MKLIGLGLLVFIVYSGFRLVVLKSQVASYKSYWQEQATSTPITGSITYVALGDSAAQGIGASKPDRGYVGLIGKALMQKTSQPVHIINLSLSGAKIKDVTEDQLPRLKEFNVDNQTVITLDVGANGLNEFNPASFRQQMDELLRALPSQTVVGEVPYFGGGLFRKRESSALASNVIIRELSSKYHLKVAPLHAETKANSGWRYFAADLFHPSDHGYKSWFKAFWETLDQN